MISAALRQSLAFEEMNSREGKIHEAHEDTFDWVFDYDRFDTNKAAFCKWLHGTDRLFWICGKAASGKSTLMRKICHDDKKLQGHLKQWAPKGIVTIAKMFFTAEGTEFQRSQEGLLRSLWEALEEQPTLAAQVLTPHLRKTAGATDKFSWTLPELRMAFDTLLKLASTEHRFCFFIDGLDEYNVISTTSAYPPEYYIETDDEKGLEIRAGHRDIAKVLLSAPENEFVKICASSRPFNDIQSIFSECPTFQLEHLTKRDMEKFVYAQIPDCLRKQAATEYEDCTDAIVENASGVFLWVSIATDTFVDGIVNGTKPPKLLAKLIKLPKKLGGPDGLYMNILQRLDPQQRADFWSMSNIMLCPRPEYAWREVTPLFLSFAIEADPEEAIAMRVNFLDTKELKDRRENIKRRLRALGNLLEFHPSPYQDHVRFMHLTVKEFLLRADVKQKVTANIAMSTLNLNVALLSTCLTMIKSISDSPHRDDENRSNIVEGALYYAAQAEIATGAPQTELLDDLDATISIICRRDPLERHTFRSNRLYWNDHEIVERDGGCHDDFMSLAVEADLTLYVQQKLEHGNVLADKPGRPLLAYAMVSGPATTKKQSDVSKASMIRLLLDHHANPNAVYEFECQCWAGGHEVFDSWPSQPSVWQMSLAFGLDSLFRWRDEGKHARWAEMVETLLYHGASPTTTVWGKGFGDNHPKEHSALFVCLQNTMVDLNCDPYLPKLVMSKGGSLRPGELEQLGDYARHEPAYFATRHAFLQYIFPRVQLSPPNDPDSDLNGGSDDDRDGDRFR
jgi:hypothetical protein